MSKNWNSDRYEDMLWMLSIGIMLEIDDDTFNVLVKLVEDSKINDFLYNFIIHSRKETVTYQDSPLLFQFPFNSLIKVINTTDKGQAIDFMKVYLMDKWYKGHKDIRTWDGMSAINILKSYTSAIGVLKVELS